MPFRDFSPFFATFPLFSRGRDRDVVTGKGIKKGKEEAAAASEKATDDVELLMNVIIACIGQQSVVVAVCSLCAKVAVEGRTPWQGCQLTEGGL